MMIYKFYTHRYYAGIVLLLAAVIFFRLLMQRGIVGRRKIEKDYSHSYKQKYIFSLNEKSAYRTLAPWAQEHGYDIFPKMRLADIIVPRSKEYYLPMFRKISQKHVDFVICDYECRVKFIIELDDNSHKRQDRVKRDAFVDQACRGAGYTIIHTRAITEELLKSL